MWRHRSDCWWQDILHKPTFLREVSNPLSIHCQLVCWVHYPVQTVLGKSRRGPTCVARALVRSNGSCDLCSFEQRRRQPGQAWKSYSNDYRLQEMVYTVSRLEQLHPSWASYHWSNARLHGVGICKWKSGQLLPSGRSGLASCVAYWTSSRLHQDCREYIGISRWNETKNVAFPLSDWSFSQLSYWTTGM